MRGQGKLLNVILVSITVPKWRKKEKIKIKLWYRTIWQIVHNFYKVLNESKHLTGFSPH